MLISLSLSNYRGFSELEIPRLSRVNLIGGVNNAGKTAILEAIYLMLIFNPEAMKKLPGLFRVPSGIDDQRYFWKWLVHSRAEESPVRFRTNFDDGSDVTMTLQRGGGNFHMHVGGLFYDYISEGRAGFVAPGIEVFSPAPTSPVQDAQTYIRAVKSSAEGEERIESLLREIDGRVRRVRAFPDETTNQPILHVGLNVGEALPASQLGQGFNRLLHIYSALLGTSAKVFLVDEVETGLHHSVLPTIWKGLAALARQQDVQIFATTHSRETILAAHRVFSEESKYDFAYHRLERDPKGEVRVVTYDQEALAGADEANFEVR